MRKLSIFLMTLFLAFFGKARATVVEIGSGTTGNSYLPTYSFYNYSMTQQIYPACEIGMAGTIDTIAFHSVGTAAKTRTLSVYFVLTDKSSFSGTKDWIAVTAADLVYSGSVTFPANNWVALPLSSPFTLDGRKNLAVIVDDNTGSYSSGLSCTVFNATGAAIRVYSDGTNYDPMAPSTYTGTVMNVKNCIRLSITEDPNVTVCCPPDAISVPTDSITAHEAFVIWEGGDAPYTLEYKTTDETTWTSVPNIADTTYKLTGLIQNTTYQARVQSGCGSAWVTSSNFTTLVSVQTPTDLVCTSTTTTDATLQWVENGIATSWIVAYKAMTDTVFTEVSVNTHPYTITGLNPSTYYTAKVCAVGGNRENSSWSAPITFVTDCVPFSTLPWDENFDAYTMGVSTGTSAPIGYPNVSFPVCWQFLNRSDNTSIYPLVFLSSSSTYAVSGNCLFFKSKKAGSVYAILPEFTEDIADLYLYFTYRNEGTDDNNGTLYVGYMTNPADSTSFTVIDTCARTTTKTEKECGFVGAPSGSYMAFRYTGGTGNNYYLGIDNVVVTTPPTCFKPSALAVSEVKNHSARLSWTENGGATAWQICLNDDENNLIDADSVPFVVSGLDAETQYTAKVRANCGGNDGVSEWCSIPVTFTTAIACVAPTSLTVTNTTNQGATLNWSNDAGEWVVAYKADADEDFTEITGITTKPYILTGLDPETYYTVKVKAVCGGIDGESLYSYTNSFTTLVACPAPNNLVCTGVTPTTATLDWTERGDATAWELCLNDDTTNYIQVGQKPFTLENLTPETTYTAKVRSACGSDWSSTISFEPTVKLVIGLGNGTNNYLPTNTLYNYSLTQQIYTVEELGEEGMITSIDFYCNAAYASDNVRTIDIYMVNTDKDIIASDTDWITVTAADKVFSSETFSMSEGWNTFQFNSAFIYDGIHNIALIVDDNTGTWKSGPAYLVTDAPSQAIYAYADNTDFDPLAPPTTYTSQDHHSKLDVKNHIRLMKTEIPDCMPVSNLTVNVAGNTAVVSWESDAEAWNMLLNGEPVNDIIVSPFTLSGLELDSTYTVEVQAVCANGISDMMSASFTTERCFVEDQCAITFTLTDSYGDGWNGAAIVVSNAETGEVLATLANENLDGTSGEETQTVTLPVCDGDILHFAWTSGSYDSETSYTVTDANGQEIVSGEDSGFEEFDYTVVCTTTVTQTIALASGSNYFSTYVDVSLNDLKAALIATGNTTIIIKSKNQNQTHTYNPSNGRWTGGLTWDVANMYIITVGEACEITLEGMLIDPAEHPITIKNGSNYIAFPLNENMSVTNAFAGFAVNGDVIKSRNGNASYTRGRWNGNVQNLTPGQGYIYVSGQSEDRILVFPQQ